MDAFRQLGTTGIRISPVVMGMWQAGKEMWAGIDDRETRRALRAELPPEDVALAEDLPVIEVLDLLAEPDELEGNGKG